MKAIKPMIPRLILGFVITLTPAVSSFAVEELKLTIRCPDVVLSWPSVEGENYIVQFRETLSIDTPWVTLTNYLPAESGTNLTIFTHSNRVDCPPGQIFGMMRSAGGDNATLSTASSLSREERAALKQAREEARLAALFEKCALEGREPYEWELKNQPPLPPSPKEVREKLLAARASRLAGASTQPFSQKENFDGPPGPGTENGPVPEGGGGIEPGCGFYRVVRDGIHLYGITNGMILSGVVTIPIEYSLSSTDQLTGFNLSADGNPLIGVDATDTNQFRVLAWDTQMMPNGTYGINAEANFLTDDSVTNELISVTVSNVISFPNYFTRIFGNWMWLYAESTIYPADYEIAMFADGTNYIGSFTGTTSDGVISFLWDLTDGSSYTFTNETFRGEFYITPVASSGGPANGPVPATPATNSFAKETAWGANDKFAIAYSAADNNSTKTLKIRSMVIGGVIGAEYGGVVSTLAIAGGGAYNLSPGNVYGSDAFELNSAETRTNLLGYLADPQYRNFYFFGHGHQRGIAGVVPASVILDQDIVHALKNFLTTGKPANRHPYRLVFIDGCATGKGNFCEGFGIPAQTLDNQFFINAGVRSRAFLGFKGTVPFNQNQWGERSLQLSYFFIDWQRFLPIEACISNVVNGTYQQLQTLPSDWVIYGAKDLRKNTPDPTP